MLLCVLATTACSYNEDDSIDLKARIPSPSLTFPVHVSENRLLEDANGDRVILVGEAAWSLIVQLSPHEVDTYLADRYEKGFNAIYVNLIEHKYTLHEPAWSNTAGDQPFLKNLPGGEFDFTTPNEAYWNHVEYVLEKAEEKGFLAIVFPAYVGFKFNESGWSQAISANGASRCREYGRWLAKRLGDRDNIVWALGGDWMPEYGNLDLRDEISAIAEGIQSVSPRSLFTAHSRRHRSAIDDYDFSWLAINTTYSDCTRTPERIRTDYLRGSMPFIFIEGIYENEHAVDLVCIRSQAYWSILGGAVGHFFGNNPIWSFEAGDRFADDTSAKWEASLHSNGSQDMVHFGDLLRSRNFVQFVPDYDHRIVVAGYGRISDSSYVASGLTFDGNTAVIYIPKKLPISVDLRNISGDRVRAWWFDPRSGEASLDGEYETAGVRIFTAPSAEDFVLVLDNAALDLSPPGFLSKP